MFIHSKLLAEQKFNNVMKLVNKTNMSSYWFMENHFVPCILHKNSSDLNGFLTVLEKSFNKLVEATAPSTGFGAKNRDLYGGEKAEQDVIDAMKKFLTSNEDGLSHLLANVHIPELTMGKTALLRKLSNDILRFVDNYKFTHPENMPPEEFRKSSDFMDENLERKTVNQMLGKRISMLLNYEGNVFDDVSNFNQENIKRYYKGLLNIENGTFTPQQEKMLANHGFAKEGIINLAKKIMEVIRKKSAHHVISATGHEEAEKLFGNKPPEQESGGVTAGFEDDTSDFEDSEDETEKVEPVKLNQYKNIRDINNLLKKEFGAKIKEKQILIKELEDGKILKGEVVSKLEKLEDIYKNKIPNIQLVFDIQTLLGDIKPRTFKYTGGKEQVKPKRAGRVGKNPADQAQKDSLGLEPDEFKPSLQTKHGHSGNPIDIINRNPFEV